MLRAIRRDIDILSMAVIGLILIGALALIGGCVSQVEPFRDTSTHIPLPSAGRNAIDQLGLQLGWYSVVCCALGIAAYIASYVPVVGPFIPRKSALVCFAVGIALAFIRAIVETLGPAGIWIGTGLAIIGGVLALWPYAVGLWNYARGRKCVGCPAGDPAPLHPSPEDGA